MAATPRQVELVTFGGLFNSYVETATPDGQCYAMDGADVGQGTVQTRPGYGDVWARSGAQTGDVGWGHAYGSFQGTKEWLAVVQPQGATTAQIYAFASDGSLLNSGTPIATGLNASDWRFAQYGNKIYAANATDGIYVRTIGRFSGNNDTSQTYLWKKVQPEFAIGSSLAVSTERPPYIGRAMINTDTVATVRFNGSGSDPNEPYAYRATIVGSGIKLTASPAWVGDTAVAPTGVIVTFAAAVDLTDVDYVYWECRPTTGKGFPILENQSVPTRTAKFALSEDGSTTLDANDYNATGNRNFARGMSYAVDVKVYGTEQYTLYYRADISNIANADKNSVRRIMFKTPCNWFGSGFEAELANVIFGAKDLWGGRAYAAPAIDYAYRYQNPSTLDSTPATKSTLAAGAIQGYGPNGNTDPLGAWPLVAPSTDGTLYSQGYMKIQVFRAASAAAYNHAWKLIGTLDNTGTPTLRDTTTESALNELTPTYELSFGNVPVTINPSGIGLWKGHVILLMDRKIYLSWAGLPTKYLPPPDQTYNPPEEDDLVQGRTLYVSDDRTDDMIAAVTQDVLYLVGQSGSYCMIGDSALDATPARRLPSSRGATGRRGACAHENGVIVGAYDGLWYYEVTRAFTGSFDGSYRVEELTRTVRESWRRLVAGGASGLIVLSANDEIWAFNAGRYLRLTRTDPATGVRQWEEGHYPQMTNIVYVPSEGVRGQLANGKLARFFYDSAGIKYTTDNGGAISWSASTGWMRGGRRRVAAIEMSGIGTPTVVIEADDGVSGILTTTVQKVSGQRWSRALSVRPGSLLRVTASGTSVSDRLDSLMFITEPIGPGEGS
jgi:hypothetical protein